MKRPGDHFPVVFVCGLYNTEMTKPKGRRSVPGIPARAAPVTLVLVVDNAGGVAGLNLRRDPERRQGNILKVLPPGVPLRVLEDAAAAAEKIGQPDQWIQVRDSSRAGGYVAAPFVRRSEAVWVDEDVIRLVVMAEVSASGGLRLRDKPDRSGMALALLPAGAVLIALDSPAEVNLAVGVEGSWLSVRDDQGRAGFVAAWYVRVFVNVPPEIVAQGVVTATAALALRAAPAPDAPEVWRVTAGTPLRVADDADWPSRVGVARAFVRVTSYAFKTGYAPAEALALPALDRRNAAENARVPVGESAWLFGMHDPYDSGLHSNGRAGWVLVTEIANGSGNPACEEWANRDWGVVTRLNNDYGGSGTIPVPGQYSAFAERCANQARNTRGCHIWIIGNEMNNPREWPNQDESNPGNNPGDSITPERYADCYNRVRAAIKAVSPRHLVIPGAVDPYNARAGSNFDWFQRMLAGLDDVDGFCLHAYTQGGSASLVSSLDTFGDDPLRWQYFHFRCYTTFLDAIPAKWRSKPVFITETNATPTQAEPAWAGGQNGWTQAAYAEIQRWNQQPHAQQIRALLLYRWVVGGGSDAQYSLLRQPGVQADFRSTVAGNDYRWRW